MEPTANQVIQFLDDEGLSGNMKTRNLEKDLWSISINEPWGTLDTKRRCGIAQIFDKRSKELRVVFNSFKATANIGDDYKGIFWKFVRLVKEFDTNQEAKFYFIKKYLVNESLKEFFMTQAQPLDGNRVFDKKSIDFDTNRFELMDGDDKFLPYYNYLQQRNIPLEVIKSYKVFADHEQKRITFPVYENNKLIFHTGRAIKKKNYIPWLKSAGSNIYPIWNLENCNGEIVNIFEGIFDALLVPSSIAILGATNTTSHYIDKILKKSYYQINIILDNDEAGHSAKYRLAEDLSKQHENVMIYNFHGIKEKDFSAMKMNGEDFDLDERLVQWNLQSQVQIRMGTFK